MYVARYRDC